MRYLALILLITLSFQAHATPFSKDMANSYYQQCMKLESPLMSDKTQDLMCSCTAANMMRNITVEEAQLSATDSPEARIVVNKILIDVYAPCIAFPAKDYYHNTCLQSPETANISKNPERLCDCMSTEVSDFLSENSQGVFADILNRQPRILDPMAALAKDPEFKKFAQEKLLSCYSRHK